MTHSFDEVCDLVEDWEASLPATEGRRVIDLRADLAEVLRLTGRRAEFETLVRECFAGAAGGHGPDAYDHAFQELCPGPAEAIRTRLST